MALTKATGAGAVNDDFISKLSRVVQLTGASRCIRRRLLTVAGFSDPVYAEAYVQVHQFDINLGAFLQRLLCSLTPACRRLDRQSDGRHAAEPDGRVRNPRRSQDLRATNDVHARAAQVRVCTVARQALTSAASIASRRRSRSARPRRASSSATSSTIAAPSPTTRAPSCSPTCTSTSSTTSCHPASAPRPNSAPAGPSTSGRVRRPPSRTTAC